MPVNKLILEPNTPVEIALKYPEGKIVSSTFGGEEMHFTLQDGKSLYLPLPVGHSISQLRLSKHEPFFICKKSTGPRQPASWDVWHTPEGERKRGLIKEPPSHLESQLAASLAAVQRKQPEQAPESIAPGQLKPWGRRLLAQTNQLIDVYALACEHAAEHGIPGSVVRTVMLSAFIGLQKNGRAA